MTSESLKDLQKHLQSLPTIGEKSAGRLALFLLSQPKDKTLGLARSIVNALEKCKPCSSCFVLSDYDPCVICSSIDREQDKLCIVESSRDVFLIENTREYHGKYFVLGNLLSPIDGIGPKELRIPELIGLVEKGEFTEVILAIPPSTEGETTMHYLSESLSHKVSNITRLSTGIPYGSDMEYTATATIVNAMRRRYVV